MTKPPPRARAPMRGSILPRMAAAPARVRAAPAVAAGDFQPPEALGAKVAAVPAIAAALAPRQETG